MVHKGNAEAQINDVLDKIDSAARISDPAGNPTVIKLHVVAVSLDAAEAFRRALPKWHSPADHPDLPAPTVTFVVGKLRQPEALIGIDAVVTSAGANRPAKVLRTPETGDAVAAVLQPGPKVYISGQAEKGANLVEMTQRTMQSLGATLKHLGLEPTDVVQVKSFLSPIEAVGECEREIVSFFGGEKLAPPQVFVEWTSPPSIEIELVASANECEYPIERHSRICNTTRDDGVACLQPRRMDGRRAVDLRFGNVWLEPAERRTGDDRDFRATWANCSSKPAAISGTSSKPPITSPATTPAPSSTRCDRGTTTLSDLRPPRRRPSEAPAEKGRQSRSI